MIFKKQLPKGTYPTSTKWIYTIKRDGNGNIKKYKARIVARGFSQTKGINYNLTYSPTLSIDSLKLLVSIEAKFKWDILILCKLFLVIIKLLFYNVELVILTKFKELLQ